MSIFLRSVGLAALSLVALNAFAGGDIGPGSKAPPLEIKSWIKGSPVKSLDPNKIYVVEFWATWCGPCKESIPHLTEIAHKNKDVTFIGVSIWEDNVDGNIQKFVTDMGDKMDYNVAYSGNKEGMAQSWMTAAGQNGIPSAFVVKNGQIAWVGHPMELEQPLAEIKAGTFDQKLFKAKFDKTTAANRAMMATNAELSACIKDYDDGKTTEAKKRLAAFAQKHPDMKSSVDSIQFGWLAKEDPTKWEKAAGELASSKDKQKIMSLCGFALRAFNDPKGNQDQGRKAIELALNATEGKEMIVLQYGIACYNSGKDYKSAFDMVNKALDLLPNSELKDNAAFKASLEKQKAELSAKLKG